MIGFIAKTAAGLLIALLASAAGAADAPMLILLLLWGVGVVFSMKTCLRALGSTMHWALQLSMLTWLAFGTGILGFLLLVVVLAFFLSFGWIYGVYLFIRDLILIIKH